MNELNYASLEASKKLVDAGIVLETECFCCRDNDGWYFRDDENSERDILETIPNPSMAEVWRELPDSTCINKDGDYTKCWVDSNMSLKVFQNENPTDALIDLLIFVRKEKL